MVTNRFDEKNAEKPAFFIQQYSSVTFDYKEIRQQGNNKNTWWILQQLKLQSLTTF